MVIARRKLFLIISLIIFAAIISTLAVFFGMKRIDYSFSENGNYYIVDKVWGFGKTYEIPDTYNDFPVRVIGENAFSGNNRLVEIDFSGNTNLKQISRKAFAECKNLKQVILSPNLSAVEQNAFLNCVKLETVTFSDCRFLGGSAFYGCSSLASITLSSDLHSIGTYAFTNTALTEITIPQTVDYIYTDAFYNATYLKYIYVYDSSIYKYDYLGNCTAEVIEYGT